MQRNSAKNPDSFLSWTTHTRKNELEASIFCCKLLGKEHTHTHNTHSHTHTHTYIHTQTHSSHTQSATLLWQRWMIRESNMVMNIRNGRYKSYDLIGTTFCLKEILHFFSWESEIFFQLLKNYDNLYNIGEHYHILDKRQKISASLSWFYLCF